MRNMVAAKTHLSIYLEGNRIPTGHTTSITLKADYQFKRVLS